MRTIEVAKLAANLDEVVRQVQEDGQVVEITDGGRGVILMMPMIRHQDPTGSGVDWSDIEVLRAEISKYWPESVSAVDAVRDVRREL